MFGILLLIVILVISGIFYNAYASVIKSKNGLSEAISGIDVQLKKRHDLIPNVLNIAKKFMEHETELMTEITELRKKALESVSGTKAKFDAENQLDAKFGQLMVSMENYPQIKSDATMLQAMKTYNEVEEHIAAARRFYNSALTQLRNSVMIYPGSLFAGLAGDINKYEYFETDEASNAVVNANDYL